MSEISRRRRVRYPRPQIHKTQVMETKIELGYGNLKGPCHYCGETDPAAPLKDPAYGFPSDAALHRGFKEHWVLSEPLVQRNIKLICCGCFFDLPHFERRHAPHSAVVHCQTCDHTILLDKKDSQILVEHHILNRDEAFGIIRILVETCPLDTFCQK
jgi:hypothetical protein